MAVLDLAAALVDRGAEVGQQRSHAAAEVTHRVGRHLVAVDLGHGREPGEVGEEERLLRGCVFHG